MPDLALPAPKNESQILFEEGVSRLVARGVSPDVARGAMKYAWRNENLGGSPTALNPTSGALGLMQWLGPRKAALLEKYGPNPSGSQQLAHMDEELGSAEKPVLDRLLGAQTEKEGYDIWGQHYERPGPTALARTGVGAGGEAPEVRFAPSALGASASAATAWGQDLDFGGIRRDSLAAAGPQIGGEQPQINVNLGPSGEAESEMTPWQRLQTLSMIRKLSGEGSHQFVQVEYDPFKVAASAKRERLF